MAVPDRLYHAAPLHYLPHIINDGALYAQSVLTQAGIAGRVTARRRDRMLGLHDYVHLSPMAQTPLLRDKIAKGYPHALLVFPAQAVLTMPQTALLPYNPKSWRTRAALVPVVDPTERDALLHRHLTQERYPSLEVLVKYGLALTEMERIAFRHERERSLIARTLKAASLSLCAPLVVNPELFPAGPPCRGTTWQATRDYCRACRTAGTVLPPPVLPFD